MKIETRNGKAFISTPYNKEFVAKIKQIGGARWNGTERCWVIPESEIDTARQYMQEVYGETDLPDDGERITVDVTFLDDAVGRCEGIALFGKPICRAFGRDSGAKVCDGITLLDGSIESGGSRANWQTIINKGAKFRIRNLTKAALQIENDFDIEVVEVKEDGINKEALRIEKEKLLARLAEINALLGEEN